ncbi:pyroglutamyl-peptidase I [Vibrio vulnificus]|uniref:Pyrrolidone-carboxylate peptidase n=1 Tax=Vibrio vulnificus TaxID=672 RepID=A0AAW4HAK3_VIBVL|nr:pyroglutamyl-peptidase I [Vibrio vulnificus]EGR0667481.1 pyroglutamyl-peptidase I [Vibrio vulnificus]ELA3116836.1 pyroglutamyl-peptidase I [Vibrio vulnificus]ELA4929672.1 pyroglutamyl-peptidase I [Vibrio vulnificus]EMB7843188.1 pyroglutamyl-peptidase I [Vibrio vulnificus]KFK50989.1 pyrrolidone-carboxylate peptidase [Vibrio vulnificus]
MRKILVTGFEPFGGESLNPSLELVKVLTQKERTNIEIIGCQVPVVRHQSISTVIEAIEQHEPELVFMIGQAAGRTAITPERVAINLDDYRIEDNAGHQPVDEPIMATGPAAYFSTLPVKAITHALQQAGIPCQLSHSAGTFVCNHLFYGIQHYLQARPIRSGFIHIPLLPEQASASNQPSMSLETLARGLEMMIMTCLETEQDTKLTGGTIC